MRSNAAPVAGDVQRIALSGEERRPVALDAPRSAIVGSRLPAGATLAVGGLFRSLGRRSSRRAAHCGQAQG